MKLHRCTFSVMQKFITYSSRPAVPKLHKSYLRKIHNKYNLKSCKSSEQNFTTSTDVIHKQLYHFCLMFVFEQRQLGMHLLSSSRAILFWNHTSDFKSNSRCMRARWKSCRMISDQISLHSVQLPLFILLPVCMIMTYFAGYLNWGLGIILTQTICFLNLRIIMMIDNIGSLYKETRI